MASEHHVVGHSVPRTDAVAKVTGAADYCVDLAAPRMLHAHVVRAERAHARINGIDGELARRMPGVTAVVTSADLVGLFPRFGHVIADHPILAIDVVRYWGEPVALVVAETAVQAADAASEVRVDYTDLPALMTAAAALEPGAAPLHAEGYVIGDASFRALSGTGRRSGGTSDHGRGAVAENDADLDPAPNVCHEAHLEWGDVEGALASAHLVLTTTMRYPMLYAYAMEPYNALADVGADGMVVHSTAQHPFMVREDLARVFGLPLSKVRVIAPYLGGGYGSKSYTKVEPLAAVGSWVVGRPVKLVLSVEESIYTTRADAAVTTVTSGFSADGRILARHVDITMDSGAYADNSPLVLGKAVNRCFGPYRVPHLKVRGRSVYTTTAPASSYRGFGTPQGALAGEVNMDQAAAALGIDPAEIRRRNLVGHGQELLPGKRPLDADIAADLDMLVASLETGRPADITGYGIGFGLAASDAGAFPISTAQVRIGPDGSATVLTGSTEMGQGSRTALSQIAAEELGLPLSLVACVQSDTAVTPFERTTGASRTTTLTGLAIVRACVDARQRARAMAAEAWGVQADDLLDAPGGISGPDGGLLSFAEVIRRWFGSAAGEITGIGLVRKGDDTALMPPFWEIGCAGVGVVVDPETGVVTVDQLVTIGDVGYAIHPAAVEGQDLGAATQGLGAALHEELVYDGPHPLNPNVVDYRVPRVADMPRRIDTQLAQRGDGIGPYGAKGAGEGALNPMGSAVAAAVARATGRWPDQLPLTPERVWRLLQRPPELPQT